jgi:hypothetical protein
VNAGRNIPVIVQFSSPALSECDAARAVPPGAFEQEVKRLCAEGLTPHGLMLLYREPAEGRGSDVPASSRQPAVSFGEQREATGVFICARPEWFVAGSAELQR